MNSKLTLNYILFLVLSFAIIFGYSYYFGPETKEQQATAPQTTQNTQNTPAQNGQGTAPVTAPAPVPAANTTAENVNHYEELVRDDNGTIITVTSPLFTAKIDTLGGRVKEWLLNDYKATTAEDSPPVNVINGEKQLITKASVNGANIPFLIPFNYSGSKNIEITDENKGITLSYTDPSGFTLTKTIEFEAANYLLNQSVYDPYTGCML